MGNGSSRHEASNDESEPHSNNRRQNNPNEISASSLPPPPSDLPTNDSADRNGNPPVPPVTLRSSSRDREYSPAHPGNHPSSTARPWKFDAILERPPLDQETLEKFSWNPEDKSLNIGIKDNDRLTFQRAFVEQSTDCIRGKVGFSRGFHVWKITWPIQHRGTNAAIGVATKEAPLQCRGYESLIGQNAESYGWDLKRNQCGFNAQHDAGWRYPTVELLDRRPFFASEDIYCILDMDEGYLSFATNNKYLGVAFRGLKGKTLYPIVSCVWGQCEITMKYLGVCEPEPPSLMEACRNSILERLEKEKEHADSVCQLPLPKSLKSFLLYEST